MRGRPTVTRRRRGREWPGSTEEPALAVAGAERQGDLAVLGRLDAFGQQDRAGAFGLGIHRVHDRGDRGGRVLLYETQIEFDHVRGDERHQRERAPVSADVIERDPESESAQSLDAGEHLGRTIGQCALGEFDDHVELALGTLKQSVRWRGVGASIVDGSTLTNRLVRRPASRAPRRAAARQAQSSSATIPTVRAAANSRSGRSSRDPAARARAPRTRRPPQCRGRRSVGIRSGRAARRGCDEARRGGR